MATSAWHPLKIYFLVLAIVLATTPIVTSTNKFSARVVKRSYEPRQKNRGEQGLKTGGVITKTGVFATGNCTVVVAQVGGTATLPCVVRKFNTGVVSWIRKHDLHLLTVGLGTYNSDDRFMVEHVRHLQNWGLLIKHVQPSDEGLYECQVSTHPPTSIIVILKVTEASAEIQGAPDLHVRAGSLLTLVCTLKQSTEPPSYVFWYHEKKMINFDHGVQVLYDKSSSILIINEAEKGHNGNYTCSPSNAIAASINVHVLNATVEEIPAAMQHANSSSRSYTVFLSFIVTIVLFVYAT